MGLSNKIIYGGLVFAQLFTFCAYVVVSAGAALLQKKANNLPLWDTAQTPADLTALQAAYTSVFVSTTYIIPYPTQPWFQFQYQWWIIEYELCIFLLTAAATLFPRIIPRVRPVALTFIASALVLVMDNINAIWFLLRNDTAKSVFDEYRIQTAQAGLIMVGIANGLTIIFMGLYEHPQETYVDDVKAHVEVVAKPATNAV